MTAPAPATPIERRRAAPARARRSRHRASAVVLLALSGFGAVQLFRDSSDVTGSSFANLSAAIAPELERPSAMPTADAFGRSGEVKVRFSLPGEPIEFPLAIGGNADSLTYEWVTITDSIAVGEARPLTADRPVAPTIPGFYHIAIGRDSARTIVHEPTDRKSVV